MPSGLTSRTDGSDGGEIQGQSEEIEKTEWLSLSCFCDFGPITSRPATDLHPGPGR
jgi:hypothetical protein